MIQVFWEEWFSVCVSNVSVIATAAEQSAAVVLTKESNKGNMISRDRITLYFLVKKERINFAYFRENGYYVR